MHKPSDTPYKNTPPPRRNLPCKISQPIQPRLPKKSPITQRLAILIPRTPLRHVNKHMIYLPMRLVPLETELYRRPLKHLILWLHSSTDSDAD